MSDQTYDFGDGPVPSKRHINPDGSTGGGEVFLLDTHGGYSMARKMTQGQSVATMRKESGFASVLDVNLKITTYLPSLKHYRYFHFDLHSGSGWNTEADCIGSPLVFLETANKYDKDIAAFFVDNDKDAIKYLSTRPELQRKDAFCFAGDNADFVTAIPYLIRHFNDNPEYAVGSIICDPNGIITIPFAALHETLKVCRRLDVIINWNSVAVKRTRNACPSKHACLPRIECLRKVLQKDYWLIREPAERTLFDPADAWQWSILVGRNMKANDYRKAGFHDINSPMGKSILSKLDNCKEDDIECPLSRVCERLPLPPCIQSNTGNGNGAGEVAMRKMRATGYRSPS